jgi:hypothetical protein
MLETPSPAVLDQYLPRIREVIVSLLQGLKGKQALLRDRERERESRGSIRSSSTSESWNREVPLAALNRGSSASQRNMIYPPPSSPPLPPMSSPRMNQNSEFDPWSGGMPRPSMPTNDLSARIMPRNNSVSTNKSYSPPQRHSPNIQHQQIPLPSRSTSSGRNMNSNIPPSNNIPPPPPPPPPMMLRPDPPPPQKPIQPQEFDENDPNTASALAALKRQENLARRSSVRRASMFRGTNSDYQTSSGGSISMRGGKNQNYYHQQAEQAPPVPSLPAHALHNFDQSPPSNRLNTVSEDVKESTPQEEQEAATSARGKEKENKGKSILKRMRK